MSEKHGKSGWPLIELGQGRVEVGHGEHQGVPALIFGSKGNGNIGSATRHGPGEMPDADVLATVTFSNIASVDVVLEQLHKIRARLCD